MSAARPGARSYVRLTKEQVEEIDGRLADRQHMDVIATAMGIPYQNVYNRRERLRALEIDRSVIRIRRMPPPNAVKGVTLAHLMGGR